MEELLGHSDKLFLDLLPSLSLHFPTLLMACTWLFAKTFWFPNGELDFRQKIFCLVFITSRLFFSQLIGTFLMTQYFYISNVQYREWRQKDALPERMLCILSIHSWHKPSSSQSNTNAFSLHLCFLDLFIE